MSCIQMYVLRAQMGEYSHWYAELAASSTFEDTAYGLTAAVSPSVVYLQSH